MNNDWEDFTKAKAVLVIGSNLTETNPLTSVRIKEAIRVYKAQVMVFDSAITNLGKLASHPYMIKPGTEGLVIDGLIKAAMCIKNRQIPPNLHFENPNPKIPFDQLPLRVPKTVEAWPETSGKALAGVNSFEDNP